MKRALLVAIVCVALPGESLAASEPTVSLRCERGRAPGRVRCEAEARSSSRALRWGDVQIVSAPSFATPLKGRIGPRDAASQEASAWRWEFALAGRAKGTGELVVRVRLLLCDGDACVPWSTEARGALVVE